MILRWERRRENSLTYSFTIASSSNSSTLCSVIIDVLLSPFELIAFLHFQNFCTEKCSFSFCKLSNVALRRLARDLCTISSWSSFSIKMYSCATCLSVFPQESKGLRTERKKLLMDLVSNVWWMLELDLGVCLTWKHVSIFDVMYWSRSAHFWIQCVSSSSVLCLNICRPSVDSFQPVRDGLMIDEGSLLATLDGFHENSVMMELWSVNLVFPLSVVNRVNNLSSSMTTDLTCSSRAGVVRT